MNRVCWKIWGLRASVLDSFKGLGSGFGGLRRAGLGLRVCSGAWGRGVGRNLKEYGPH